MILKISIVKHSVFQAGSQDSLTLNKFRVLLETHYHEHWPVAEYTRQLHLSTSTLNRLCQHYFNSSPKVVIQEKLLGKAKRRLRYTQQSIEDIADTLGFKDQAYFSRFF